MAWQIWEYPTHEEYPPVQSLPIHLPGQQPIYFGKELTPSQVQERLTQSSSKLMGFFDYNWNHLQSQPYLYQDFPAHYVWLQKEKRWKSRQFKFAVGRIHHCNPLAGERYYLRLLLTVVPGPQSYEDL